MRYVNCVVLSFLFLFVPMAGLAGSLDSPAAPTDINSAMYTLEDIYNRLNAGTAGVPKTGQTVEYNDGDDAAWEKEGVGVAWPNPRFTDNLNGTVTDILTGLTWLKNASCGTGLWAAALSFCNALEHGQCGLLDDSSAL